MRSTLLVVAIMYGATSLGVAQQWSAELGIQAAYTRIKGASSQPIDLFGTPADMFGILPSSPSLFVVLSAARRLAMETSLGLLRTDEHGFLADATLMMVGARANYAITSRVYLAGGGTLQWIAGNNRTDAQFGLQSALGYRFWLGGLRGRVEAKAHFLAHSDELPPTNLYALAFGISRSIRPPGSAQNRHRAWEPAFGIQGGYSRAHIVGSAENVDTYALPGLGSTLTLFNYPAAPSTLFFIVPLTGELAVEPAFDFHRIQTRGVTLFGASLSLRADYAITRHVYAAAGGNLVYLKGSGFDGETMRGAQVSSGYRFPVSSGVRGRLELSYTMMKGNNDIPFPAVNTLSLQLGAAFPLH